MAKPHTHDDDPHPTTPSPCPHNSKGRNLIVCIDGTSNQFGDKVCHCGSITDTSLIDALPGKNTNVIELYNLIVKTVGGNQKTWYNSGIGTYAQPSWKSPKYYAQVIYHHIDLAIAWYVDYFLFTDRVLKAYASTLHRDFEKTVQGAYRWLSDNYEPGDSIFLFGVSIQSLSYHLCINHEGHQGFSRGAFQVRALSAMIDKVRYVLPFRCIHKLMFRRRSASSTRATRCRYHCALP